MSTTFDVIVIGAGSAGLTAAVGCAKVGKRVLLIEREHLGGECTNSGCIPSKALLHHAKAYAAAVDISDKTPSNETFRQAALAYVQRKITEVLADETPAHFESQGITVVMGEAVFTSANTVQVKEHTYTFNRAIIATGSAPRLTTIPGLTAEQTLTNQNLFNLTVIPERLLIVGGGPIGLEMGQAFALLGSQVTIVDTGSRFAKLEEVAVAKVTEAAFMKLGITFVPEGEVMAVSGNLATIYRKNTEISETISFDKVLVAIGRVPNLPTGLTQARITHTESGIVVNQNYQTSNRNVYAIGDVAERLKFTHMADDTARQVVTHLVSRGLLSVNPRKAVPKVTYTSPEMAQVGLSWDAAVSAYGADRLHRIEVSFAHNDRARTDDVTDGVLVVIARRLSGKILGAHIAGPAAGELINIFTIAIDQKLSLWKLRNTIFAYPTYALIIKKAGDYFFAAQIGTLKHDLKRTFFSLAPKVLLAAVWVYALYQLYDYQQTFGLTITELALNLFSFITGTVWGPVLYILTYAIRPLTFIPATPLTLSAGIFFGFWGGLIYTIIGANLSASVAYAVGRFFGSNLKLENTILRPYVGALRSNPFSAVLTTRLLFMPFDVVNYGAGILRLPFIPYLLATIIGTLLGIATFISVGAALSVEEVRANGFSVAAIDAEFLVLSGIIFIASLGVAKLLKKRA